MNKDSIGGLRLRAQDWVARTIHGFDREKADIIKREVSAQQARCIKLLNGGVPDPHVILSQHSQTLLHVADGKLNQFDLETGDIFDLSTPQFMFLLQRAIITQRARYIPSKREIQNPNIFDKLMQQFVQHYREAGDIDLVAVWSVHSISPMKVWQILVEGNIDLYNVITSFIFLDNFPTTLANLKVELDEKLLESNKIGWNIHSSASFSITEHGIQKHYRYLGEVDLGSDTQYIFVCEEQYSDTPRKARKPQKEIAQDRLLAPGLRPVGSRG